MNRDFIGAILQLNAEKNLPKEQLVRTVEDAIQSAYRRVDGSEDIQVRIDADTGKIRVYRARLVVDGRDVEVDGDGLLLLSSDGLHGVVSEAEITEILASGGTLEQQAQRLITAARAHGGPDNITVVLIQR